MKTLLVLGMMVLSMSSVAETAHVKVSGMVCSMCAQGIQKKFSEVPNVKKVEVDLDKKLVTVEALDEKKVSDEDIKSAISKAGYNVQSIERTN